MSIYLDHAATSREKPECVCEAIDRFMRHGGGSPGRSVHAAGIAASRIVADAREGVADLLGATDPARIIFTLNCTEALNLAIRGTLTPGSHVVTTAVEHNSVMRPLDALSRTHGITFTHADASEDGTTPAGQLRKHIRADTRMVIMTHASNVTGAIQPIEEWGATAREHGIPFLVDAAQTTGTVPIELAALPVDMLAFSGHKGLLGPQGTGGLYISDRVLPEPLVCGGTGSFSDQAEQPSALPDRYESGTPNTPGLAGLAAAAAFLRRETIEAVRAHVVELGTIIIEALSSLPRVVFSGSLDMNRNAGTFSFTIRGIDPTATAMLLEDRYGILARVGLHCAPCAHQAIGTYPSGTVRVSIGHSTTPDDVDTFIAAVAEMCNV